MTNTPSPRHLQHGAPVVPEGPFGGRQAARIRAIAGSNLLPEERALADALVMTAWLTASQRARYGETLRAASDADDILDGLADERRVVLSEGADPVDDELESAAVAERAARQLPLRLLEALLLLIAGGLVAAVVLRVIDAEEPGLAGVPVEAWPLAAGLGAALVAAAVVGAAATRRRDRSLLEWASGRPGQLGRGLPLLRPLQGDSAGPAVLRAVGPAVLFAAGIIAICIGAAVLLISLLNSQEGSMAPALWSLGGGVLALLLAVVAVQLRGRRLEQIVRRARAAEWYGHTSFREDEEQPEG
jgi:hypothetical protein